MARFNASSRPASTLIPPNVYWTDSGSCFFLKAPSSSADLAELVVVGWLDVPTHLLLSQSLAHLTAVNKVFKAGKFSVGIKQLLMNSPHLRGRLKERMSDSGESSSLRVYCHRAYRLPYSGEVVLALDIDPPLVGGSCCSENATRKAAELFDERSRRQREHRAIVAEFDLKNQRYKEQIEAAGRAGEFENIFESSPPPFADIDSTPLAVLLPNGFLATVGGASYISAISKAEKGVVFVDLPPRDGAFSGAWGPMADGGTGALLCWSAPVELAPSYPEMRWYVQRRLSKALRNPRYDGAPVPPDRADEGPLIDVAIAELPDVPEEIGTFEFQRLDRVDASRRAKEDVAATGFEAYGWYSPWHSNSEERWGIYLHAQRLDSLGCALAQEIRGCGAPSGVNPDALGALLATGLVLSHERFHARVEAVLTWHEMLAAKSIYLRAKTAVYETTWGTDDCLEEALANWASWSWYEASDLRSNYCRLGGGLSKLDDLVRFWLNLGPPGYRVWALGREPYAWRSLFRQWMALSKSPPNALAPVERVLQGPYPFDMSTADVPVYFFGSGQISSALSSLPNRLNQIARRELLRALRYFGYEVKDKAAGKGSHEKWVGPTGRMFIVARRDPVSLEVFDSFLAHFGLSRAAYIQDVRPQL